MIECRFAQPALVDMTCPDSRFRPGKGRAMAWMNAMISANLTFAKWPLFLLLVPAGQSMNFIHCGYAQNPSDKKFFLGVTVSVTGGSYNSLKHQRRPP
jgi:hypothetical protein